MRCKLRSVYGYLLLYDPRPRANPIVFHSVSHWALSPTSTFTGSEPKRDSFVSYGGCCRNDGERDETIWMDSIDVVLELGVWDDSGRLCLR